jgi:hypothetical protein
MSAPCRRQGYDIDADHLNARPCPSINPASRHHPSRSTTNPARARIARANTPASRLPLSRWDALWTSPAGLCVRTPQSGSAKRSPSHRPARRRTRHHRPGRGSLVFDARDLDRESAGFSCMALRFARAGSAPNRSWIAATRTHSQARLLHDRASAAAHPPEPRLCGRGASKENR